MTMTISELGRQTGLRASAIRYYEKLGILLSPQRVRGQRRYSVSAVYRLAVVRRAQASGFTLAEIRQLLFGFRSRTPISSRWRHLAGKKIAELDARMAEIQGMKDLLMRLQDCCGCETVEQCGAAMLRKSPAAI